jgi:uncharacterized Zn finger protein (UPF0148 family)
MKGMKPHMICYPLRADKDGKVYCKHCGKLLENQKKVNE